MRVDVCATQWQQIELLENDVLYCWHTAVPVPIERQGDGSVTIMLRSDVPVTLIVIKRCESPAAGGLFTCETEMLWLCTSDAGLDTYLTSNTC